MKKELIHIMIFSLLLQVGCSSSSYINADEYSDEYKSDLTGVILKDSTEYELGRTYNIINDTLWILNFNSTLEPETFQKAIPLNDISKFVLDSVDPVVSVIIIVGAIVLFFIVIGQSMDFGVGGVGL